MNDIEIIVFQGKTIEWLLANPLMKQYLWLRWMLYCQMLSWEDAKCGESIEYDAFDGANAIYILIICRGKVVFGWRILQKKFVGTLPAEKELAKQGIVDGKLVQNEVTRFVIDLKRVVSLRLTPQQKKYCMDLLFETSYKTLDVDRFIVLLNLNMRKILVKIMGDSWHEEPIGEKHLYKKDCEFQAFLLFK